MPRSSAEGSGGGVLGRATIWLGSPYLLLGLAILFWAGNFVVGRAAREVIPPIAFNFWRWAVALGILLPFAWPEIVRSRHVILREWRILAALGATGMSAFHSAVYIGLSQTEAINGALYFATSPLFFVLLCRMLFGERIGGRQAVGIAVSMVGAVIVIARGDLDLLLGFRLAIGDLWLMLAVALWALYSVLLARRPADLPPLALLSATIIMALLLLVPLYALELAAGRTIEFGLESLISLGYVSVFASVIAYILYNRGVREVGPSPAGVMLNLMPIFSAVLAIAFLDERLAPYHWIGAALLLAGILLARRPARALAAIGAGRHAPLD
jgi:drug/metabolite transporter (DMT)-like permease